eukprot:2721964-Amphidinium_carterae.1
MEVGDTAEEAGLRLRRLRRLFQSMAFFRVVWIDGKRGAARGMCPSTGGLGGVKHTIAVNEFEADVPQRVREMCATCPKM